jgi:hypothetical protein
MIYSNYFSIPFLCLGLLFTTCQGLNRTHPVPEENSKQTETEKVGLELSELSGKPYFGFNAKANLKTKAQVSYVDAFLEEIPSVVRENLTIRLPGGTLSQKVYSSDFSDADIESWVSLQKKYALRLIFVVNGNDSPENQRKFIERWISAGAQFDFIEMMNEYYLSKFFKGFTDKKEVSQKITPQLYVEEILPAFFKELDKLDLPYFVICAPEKKGKPGERLAAWNTTMVSGLNGKFKDRKLGIVIHLYQKGVNSEFDYSQINRLRDRISYKPKVAITEMGVLDDEVTWLEIAAPTKQHYTQIFQQLGSGDYLFDQVLFNDYPKDNTATLHPKTNGITPKGEKVVELIKAVYQ